MNGLISLISLSALLLVVSGQLSSLSPSYSYQGITGATTDGVTSTGTIRIYVDIVRGLAYVKTITTMTGQDSVITIDLYSSTDDALYTSVDGTCTQTVLPSGVIPLDRNVWNKYAAGIENPTGTFTYTESGTTYQIVIINQVPRVISTNSSTSISTISVSNFDSTTPAFSTFPLLSECSQFTCNACYSSAVSVSISVLLLLTTLLLYLFSTH